MVKLLRNSFISCEVDCACTVQLKWCGKYCTKAKDNVILKNNGVINYDNISVITACHTNFDIVDSSKLLTKKNVISTNSCFVI